MRRFSGPASIALRTPSGAVFHVVVAERFRLRLAGLAALPSLPLRWALLIPRCRSVHTVGMRFPIDVAFVVSVRGGAAFEVLSLHERVRPHRLVRSRHRARPQAALELPAGAASRAGLRANARLEALELRRARGRRPTWPTS